MHFVWRVRSAKFQSLTRPSFSNSRTQLAFLGKLFFCHASVDVFAANSEIRGYSSLKVDESFPNPPDDKEKPVAPLPSFVDSKKLKAISRVSEIGPNGKRRPQVLYLIELGVDLDQIESMTCRFPNFIYYSLEGKIKPLVEFLLDLGVPKSDVPTIFNRSPRLFGLSLSENLIPTMAFLEGLGVDKKRWAKLICGFPGILCYGRQKMKSNVDFLHEMGLSAESIGKILTQFPQIIGCSVEDKLRPVTEFFLERGYSMEEVRTMISRFGNLYSYSLAKNLIPKWEFFLTMNYPRHELVKFPQYFGYSLEQRIKPRYALMKECGVVLPLSTFLSSSSDYFHEALKSKVKQNAC
ncbi:hypothetical protein FNV43_RR22283 [Rhamnella rubrinervis]|uniref:Mitochondrial transcription termination factor n=1 Tax=Rhamnella rubrinervis TaxID=2594499 RepID=A0A8K0DUX2_9ROSA|nr:hypothetical protein FNV43_RR22283 [Rhamnella rubrinervis]